ncbi:MAG: hypothetical protein EBR30_15035 [Cytophagia bacterium]|nr:hypothetical protein [Cytophagia bacterium]
MRNHKTVIHQLMIKVKMMIIKSFLITGLTLSCILSYAQEDFNPTKPDYISESDFRRGEMILKNAR